MAEEDLEGFDVKDEELVDFEGSDYGFCSDEELDVEEEQNENTAENKFLNPQELVKHDDTFAATQVSKKEENSLEIPDTVKVSLIPSLPQNRDESEAGEIENSWQEKLDTVSTQPLTASASSGKGDHKETSGDAYHKKHYKADLEDGELVDIATMPDGSDHEAVRSPDNDKDDAGNNYEKKRRRYRFSSERHSNGPEQDRKEHFGSGYGTGRHFRGRERPMERPGGFSQFVEGRRGMNFPVPGFGGPNFGRGAMGPGRPLVPGDLFAQVPLPHVGHGLMVPPGGMTPPGRPDFPVSDVIVQEQLLQCQRMAHHIAQLGGPGIGRPQLNRPIGSAPLHHLVGLEFMGPSQGMMQLQPQGPEISSNSSGRGHRSSFAEGRGSMSGAAVSGPGQQNGRLGWVPLQLAGNSHFRGRGQGRGHLTTPAGPYLGDNMMVGGPLGMDAFQPNFSHTSGFGGQMLNIGDACGPTIPNSNAHIRPPQFHGGMHPAQASNSSHGFGERVQRNGFVQNAKREANNTPAICANFKGRNMGNQKNESRQEVASSPVSSTISRGNGNNSSSVSSVIHLSGPIQKTRVLTVCGLPANTPMSTIVESFEKQGKIMDFRKNEQGDVFTITFSNVTDAVSAKRRLHRSMLAGRQITVEYST